MELTATGAVLIVIGLACLHRPFWLTCLVLGSVTFSATAIVNVPSVPFGLQPYHWFGLLLIVSTILFRLPSLVRAASPFEHAPNGWLYAFLAWGMVAAAATGAVGTSIAHMVHLTLGTGVMLCIVANTTRAAAREAAVKALVAGTLLAAGWGAFELACTFAGIPYPEAVFNNSAGEFVGGTNFLWFGLPRVRSVSTEPSYLVRSLVPVLCIFVTLWLYGLRTRFVSPLLRPFGWKVTLLILLTLLSTSALGSVALALVGLLPLVFGKRARVWIAACYVGLAALLAYLVIAVPALVDLADEVLFGKLESGSGTDRLSSVADASASFAASPVFGAGPGLVTSHDLILKLLSNFGLVGAALFLSLMASALWHGWRATKRFGRGPQAALCLALTAANVMLLIMDALAGVSYQYGIFWALLGLLISASRLPGPAKASRSKVSRVTPAALPAVAPGLDHHHRAQR